MPMYTYRCDACGASEDHLHPAANRLQVACPECDSPGMVWQFPCPNLVTDSTFLAGSDDGFGDDNHTRQLALAKAREAGVSTAGMVFKPGLCRRQKYLDPYAWVDGRGDVKRRCKEQGWGCSEGSVKVKPVVRDEPDPLEKPYQVRESIVQEHVDMVAEDQGGMSKKERSVMAAECRETFSGR